MILSVAAKMQVSGTFKITGSSLPCQYQNPPQDILKYCLKAHLPSQ